jgi:hypothetical protein
MLREDMDGVGSLENDEGMGHGSLLVTTPLLCKLSFSGSN